MVKEDMWSSSIESRFKIEKDEWCRIYSGLITEWDFNTASPRAGRIDQIANGINDYIRHKRRSRV